MGMSVGGGGDDGPMMEINTTPLIDVMLVAPDHDHHDDPDSERTR